MRKETFNRALVLSLAASMMASTTPLQPIQVKAASEETQVKKNDTLALTLNYSTYTVKKGETLKLKASISQAAEKNKKITWHTSDKTIVSVTQDGVVTGVKKGKATITAQIDGTKIKTKCIVTVGTAVTGLTVKENTQTIKEGKTLKLEAAITPSNASNKKLTYTSSDKTVTTVSSTGVVTAKKPGKAVITIKTTDGSAKTAKVAVTVEEAVTDLVITKNSLKNNKLTVTGGVYNNITIENSVGSQAAIYFKNIKVKGNLILQDGVDYNVAINMASNVANVICTSDVAGAQKEITKLSTEGKKSPIFKVKGSSIVGKIIVDKADDFALVSNKKADIKEVEVIHEANKKTDLSLTAYKGKLTIQGAEKGELNVRLAGSEIPDVSIEGTAANQKVTFNATTTSTLKKIEANAPYSQIIINGVHAKVSELITNAKGVLVSILEKANVGNIIIKGENTSVTVDKDSSIDNIDVQEKGGTIKGEGTVENVDVSADGTKIETVGTKVEVSNGVDGTIAGGIGLNGGAEITTGNNSSDSSASGSSSGGSSGGGSSDGGSSGGDDTVWNPEFEAAVSALRKILDNYAEPTKLLDGVTLEDIEKAQALVNKVPQIYQINLQKKVDLAKEFLKERTLKEIEEAEKAIQIKFAEGDNENSVTSAFELPKTGLYGTQIKWESNSDAVIIKDGVVTIQRPLYVDGNKEVVLSATVQKDGVQSTTAVTKKVVILSVDKTALQSAIITIKEAAAKEDIKKILENPEYVTALELNVTGFDILAETEQDTVLQSIVDWETRKDFGIEIGSSLERAKRQFNQKWNELVSREETDNQKEKDSKDIQEALDLLDTYIFGEIIPEDRVKTLTESIELPTTYRNDVSVQWIVKKAETSPAKTGNFDNNGTVVRPDYSDGVDGVYTLKAVCTKGIGEVEDNTKEFKIIITKKEASPIQTALETFIAADTIEKMQQAIQNTELDLDIARLESLGKESSYYEAILKSLVAMDKTALKISETEVGESKKQIITKLNTLVEEQAAFKVVVDTANQSLDKAESVITTFKSIYEGNKDKFTLVEQKAAERNLENIETAITALKPLVASSIDKQDDIKKATQTLDEKIANLEKNIDTLKIILEVANNLKLENLQVKDRNTSKIVGDVLQIVTAEDLKLPKTIGSADDKLEISWSSDKEDILQTKTIVDNNVKYEHAVVNPPYKHNATDGKLGSITGQNNIDDYDPTVTLTAIVTSAIGGEAKAVNFKIGVKEAKSNLNYLVELGKGGLSTDGKDAILTRKDITDSNEKDVVANLKKATSILNVPNTTTIKEFAESLVASSGSAIAIMDQEIKLDPTSEARLGASENRYRVVVTAENEIDIREYSVAVLKKSIAKSQVTEAEEKQYTDKKYISNKDAIDVVFTEDSNNTIEVKATKGLTASTDGSKRRMMGVVVDFADCVIDAKTEITNLAAMNAEVLEGTKVVFWLYADNETGEEITQDTTYTVNFKDGDTLPLRFTYTPTAETVAKQYVESAKKKMDAAFFTNIFGAAGTTDNEYKVPFKKDDVEITKLTLPADITGSLIQGETTTEGKLPVTIQWKFTKVGTEQEATVQADGTVVRPVYTEGDLTIEATITIISTAKDSSNSPLVTETFDVPVVIEKEAATDLQAAIEALNNCKNDSDMIAYLAGTNPSVLGIRMKDETVAGAKKYGYESLTETYCKIIRTEFLTNKDATYDVTKKKVEESKKAIVTLFNSLLEKQVIASLTADAQAYVNGLTYDKDIKPLNTQPEGSAEASDKITKDFVLPTTYTDDKTQMKYNITWTASGSAVSATGSAITIENGTAKVTRPEYKKTSADEEAILNPTVTFKYDTERSVRKEKDAAQIKVTVLQKEATDLQKAIVAANALTTTTSDADWKKFLADHAGILKLELENTVSSTGKVTSYGYNSLSSYYQGKVRKAFIDGIVANGPYAYDLTITSGTTTKADESQKAIQTLFNVSSQFVSMREDAQNYVDGLTYDKDIKTITTNTEEKEAITKDFTLPLNQKDAAKGVEYEITWTTASPSAIHVEGATAKVTRPAYSAETKIDEKVILVPTVSLKGFADIKENTGITKGATSSAIEVTVLMAEASKEQKAIVALREAIKGTDGQTDDDRIAAVKSVLEASDHKDIFKFEKYTEYTDLKKKTAYEEEADTASYQNAVAEAVFKLGTSKLDYTLKEVQNTLQTIRTAFDNQVTYEVSLKEEVTTAFENIKKAEDKLQEMITAGKYNSGTEEEIKKVTQYTNLEVKIQTTKNKITSAKETLDNKISDITKAIKEMNDYVENEIQIYIDTQYVAGVKTKITKKNITFEFGKDAEDNKINDTEDSVSSIFTLPTNDSPEIKDLTIKWASKTTTATGGAITINAEGNQVESITRPKYTDGNGTVILTATITRGKQTKTAERTLTIKKKQGTPSQVAVEEINSAKELPEIAAAITKNYTLYGITETDYNAYNGTAFDGNITIDGVTYTKREIVQAIVRSGIEYSVELVTDNGNETEEAVGAAKIGEVFKVAYTAVLKYTEADTKKSDYISTAVTSIKDSVYKNVESPYNSIGAYFEKAMKKETDVNIADITTQVETIQTALEVLQTSIDAANEAVKQVASLIAGSDTAINKVTKPDTIALKANTYYNEINNVLDKLHTSCGGTVSKTPADATCYFETESRVLLDAVAVLKAKNNEAILEKVNNLVDKNADSKITDFKDGFKYENIETIPGTKVSTSTASGSSITASGSAIVIDVLSMESEAIYTTATGGAATVTEIQNVFGTVKEFYNNQQILRSQFGVIFDTDFGSSNMEGKLTGSLAAEKMNGVNAGATYTDINALIRFLENEKLAASTKDYYVTNAVAKGKLLWNQELGKQINNLFMGGDVSLGIAEKTTIQDIRGYKEKVENEFFTDIDTDNSFQNSLKTNLDNLTTLYCNRMKTNAISAQGVMNKLVTGEIVDGKIQWADGIGDLALSQIYNKIGEAEESIKNIMSGLDATEADSTDIGTTYQEVEKINTELQSKLAAAKNTYDADTMSQVKALYKSPILPSLDDIALKDEELADGVQKATIETLVTDAAKAFNEATRKEVTGYADMALDIYVRTEKAFELLDKVSKLVVIEPEGTNVIGLAEDATFNSINIVVQEFALTETEFDFTEKDKEKAGKPTLDTAKDLWNEKVRASIDMVYDKETGFKTQDKTELNSVLEKVTDVFTGLDSTPEISPEDVQKEWNEAIYSNLKGLVTSINVDTSAASGSMITVGELTDPNIDAIVISSILSQAGESGLFDVTISVDGNDYTREMLIELSRKILIVWKNTPQSTSYAVQQIADILDLDLDKVEGENELQNSGKNEIVTQPEKETPTPEVPKDETPVETPAPEVPKDETPVETPTPEVPEGETPVETPTPEVPKDETPVETPAPKVPEDETSVETPTPETSGEVETNK